MTLKSTQDVYVPRSSSSDSAVYECIATNYPGNKKEQRKTSIDFQGSCHCDIIRIAIQTVA